MRLYVLVEGPSEKALLDVWLGRLLKGHRYTVIKHRGKGKLPHDPMALIDPRREGLLDQLPARLRAYGKALDPSTDRVVVLVDADEEDCTALKKRLVSLLKQINPRPEVIFRIAVEETEAFYLGDRAAIRAAFPQARFTRLRSYKQDSVCGTWELFQEVIGAMSEDKVGWAERMAPHLTVDPLQNESPSFRQLCYGLQRLVGELGTEGTPRKAGVKGTSGARSQSRRSRKGAPRAE